jgi:hypothetical protein
MIQASSSNMQCNGGTGDMFMSSQRQITEKQLDLAIAAFAPVVWLCSLKRRQEGVVDVDGARPILLAEVFTEYLHVSAAQHAARHAKQRKSRVRISRLTADTAMWVT